MKYTGWCQNGFNVQGYANHVHAETVGLEVQGNEHGLGPPAIGSAFHLRRRFSHTIVLHRHRNALHAQHIVVVLFARVAERGVVVQPLQRRGRLAAGRVCH